MIVREAGDAYILIEQDNHAKVSGEIASSWKDALFEGKEYRHAVEYAIRYHDAGWKYFDKEPFWNEKLREPYDFDHFPLAAKTVIYQQGINEVEEKEPYAALLCSMHYSRFMEKADSEHAKWFLKKESIRQARIIDHFGNLNKRLINLHFQLLRFADQLSLYVCLNEPGAAEEQVHYFFRQGIPLPSNVREDKLHISWKGKNTLMLRPFPFEEEFSVTLKQKKVKKDEIRARGIAQSYEHMPYKKMTYTFTPQK